MAELKLPRLLAAAKEFNIGQDTLIAFLIGKGFPKDELKPTSKLTEEMYRALQQEFQSDKAAKMKSDQLELPKGAQAEAKKKKEEEEISFRKEEKPAVKIIKKEEPKPVEEVKPVVALVPFEPLELLPPPPPPPQPSMNTNNAIGISPRYFFKSITYVRQVIPSARNIRPPLARLRFVLLH